MNGDLAQAMDLAQSTLRILHQTPPADADTFGCIHLEIARIGLAMGDKAGARVHARKARHHQLLADHPAVLADCEELLRELGETNTRDHAHEPASSHDATHNTAHTTHN
jgi:hypothetical protein